MVFGFILFSFSGGLVILFSIRKKISEISKQIYQRIIMKDGLRIILERYDYRESIGVGDLS